MTESETPGQPEAKTTHLQKLIKKILPRRIQEAPIPHDPDRPYGQKNLVPHPEGGTVPAGELLDLGHHERRTAEIIDQDSDPRSETSPLPEKEIPTHALELVMSLREAVAAWDEPEEIDLEDGKILKNYSTTVESAEGITFFTVQLIHPDAMSETPNYGNLTVVKPTPLGQREYYFQAKPTPRKIDKPLIYYNDYPYHEESLGRPESNTVGALEGAKGLIAELPRTT